MAIVAAAVVPHPPALLPGLTGTPIAEIEELRAHTAAAVRWVLDAGPDLLLVVAGGPRTGQHDEVNSDGGGYRGRVVDGEHPLGLAVVAALLPPGTPRVEWHAVDHTASGQAALDLGATLAARSARVGLVIAGDGSARRGPKAPGYLDSRAAPFDAVVEAALAGGDVAALRTLDATLAADLLVAGRAAWQVLAGAVGSAPVAAALDYAGDPFGVWCGVARWRVG